MSLQTRPRRHSWSAIVGLALLISVVAPTVLAGLVAPYDPNALASGLRMSWPSWAHPFGTDLLGRDQLTRVLYGGRTALTVAAMVLACTVTIGAVMGCVAGYYGGWLDGVISTLLNILLALPSLSLTIALIAVLGPGELGMMIALTATAWCGYARLFRGSVLAVRNQPYVEAARAAGATDPRILRRHVLPNVARPILALASLHLAGVILAVSALSFLGLGVQPPTADWGTMLSDARPYLYGSWYLAIPPAACILIVSLGANLVADALLDRGRPVSNRGL